VKNKLPNLSFANNMMANVVITQVKFALQVIGEWSETNVNKDPDTFRDKDVIDAIRFVDKSAGVLLQLGVNPEDVSKLLSTHLKKTIQPNNQIK